MGYLPSPTFSEAVKNVLQCPSLPFYFEVAMANEHNPSDSFRCTHQTQFKIQTGHKSVFARLSRSILTMNMITHQACDQRSLAIHDPAFYRQLRLVGLQAYVFRSLDCKTESQFCYERNYLSSSPNKRSACVKRRKRRNKWPKETRRALLDCVFVQR